MKTFINKIIIPSILLSCCYSYIALAENYALLVGISDYPNLPVLEGPRYDVEAIDLVLRKNWSFASPNIDIILNKKATKTNILQAIDRLYERSDSGDNIFIYFSGHGTSQFDPTMTIPLPHTTGAFIPYDVFDSSIDYQTLVDKLIIGKRDLFPRFKRFDIGGRHLFVVVDSCYSGNTVRGYAKNRFSSEFLPTRYIDFFSKFIGDKKLPTVSNKNVSSNTDVNRQNNSYPYDNIYYLGAASQYEKSIDIPRKWLEEYPTIDGQPHGAFTDSLLRVLDNPLSVDVDNNGAISYIELKQGVSDVVQERGFNHMPNGLPTLADDTNKINHKNVFFLTRKNISQQVGKPRLKPMDNTSTTLAGLKDRANENAKLPVRRLTLKKNNDKKMQAKIPDSEQMPGISFDKSNADINVINDGQHYIFYNRTGNVIAQNKMSETDYIYQIKYLNWLNKMQTLLDAPERKMLGEMQGVAKGLRFVEGDTLGFVLHPIQAGYLMIVNFSTAGEINLLYPATPQENVRYKAKAVLKKYDFAQVTAPFGREVVYALMFDRPISLPEHLLGSSFVFDHPHAQELFQFITDNINRIQRKKFVFYTDVAVTDLKVYH